MREIGRERNSGSFGHKGYEDFRSKLHSVHVDNINPIMDPAGMWSIFKPFGRVRDVHLSPKNGSRSSLYAFVRFESKEEATKVARLTNGMHVYGWPIVSKVATFGWNRRRTATVSRPQFKSSGTGMENVRRSLNQNVYGQKTFVEAVQAGPQKEGMQPGTSKGPKELLMVWRNQNEEKNWLSKCALGTLKDFLSVESINERLKNRGIHFTSHFLGAKYVLWSFDTEMDKEGFINNSLFWEDRFSSMRSWSDVAISDRRLAWISCTGVPLCYWSTELFAKLGGVIGETLLVDEETSKRTRLDKGRVLVLVHQDELVSENVRIDMGNRSFVVRAVEEVAQVEGRWVEQFLGLNKIAKKEVQIPSRRFSVREEGDRVVVGVQLDDSRQVNRAARVDCGVSGGEDRVQSRQRKPARRRKKVSDLSSMDTSEFEFSFSNFLRKDNRDKGKQLWVPKQRRIAQRKEAGKFWIDEQISQRNRGVGSDSISTSVDDGLFLKNGRWKGENSRQGLVNEGRVAEGSDLYRRSSQAQQIITVSRSPSLDRPVKEFLDKLDGGSGLEAQEYSTGPQRDMLSTKSLDSSLKEYLEIIEQAFIRATFLKGQSSQAWTTQSGGITIAPNTASSDKKGISSSNSVSVVPETILSSEEESSAMEDTEDDNESIPAMVSREMVQKECVSSSKKRRNCEDRDVNKNDISVTTNGGEPVGRGWISLEEEVDRILDLGSQLGIDFMGKEKEMADFIRSRELEEAGRLGQKYGQ